MFGAVAAGAAAGGYATIDDAARQMARLGRNLPARSPPNQAIYDQLYREYVRLHDYFGRGENDVMKRLKRLKEEVVLTVKSYKVKSRSDANQRFTSLSAFSFAQPGEDSTYNKSTVLRRQAINALAQVQAAVRLS